MNDEQNVVVHESDGLDTPLAMVGLIIVRLQDGAVEDRGGIGEIKAARKKLASLFASSHANTDAL
jgi:hypothetical protein